MAANAEALQAELKKYILVFVALLVLTAVTVGVGAWGVRVQQVDGQGWPMQLGVAAFALAAITAVYGVWFLKKLKNVSYA